MATIWTPERNERLLLLILGKDFKVDAQKLSDAWKQQYGLVDTFAPTKRAIQEQIGALKKKAAVKGGAEKTTRSVPSTPKTPRTATKATQSKSAKTSTSATPSKRKKANMNDDEDSGLENDDDTEIDLKNLPPALSRASLSRTKKVPKRYEESASEDEKADEESDGMPIKDEIKAAAGSRNSRISPMSGLDEGDEIHVAGTKPKTNGTRLDSVMPEGAASGNKKMFKKLTEMEDDSDVSDFAKSFG